MPLIQNVFVYIYNQNPNKIKNFIGSRVKKKFIIKSTH